MGRVVPSNAAPARLPLTPFLDSSLLQTTRQVTERFQVLRDIAINTVSLLHQMLPIEDEIQRDRAAISGRPSGKNALVIGQDGNHNEI